MYKLTVCGFRCIGHAYANYLERLTVTRFCGKSPLFFVTDFTFKLSLFSISARSLQ